MKNRNAFTLVELLAVIVILAIILVIAVPKITDTIKNSKIASFESSAKTIASQAEKKKMENEILENQNPLSCSDVVKLNDTDYGSCSITFDGNTAKVNLIGKGKFEGLQIINGTKDSATALDYNLPEYGIGTDFIKNIYNDEKLRNLMGLEKDTTSDENIRYVGLNPYNYVEFNGEAWRIIGVFGNNVKLVRDEILTAYSFDNKTKEQGIDSDYGTNDWTKSYLREFLNDYYYDGKTITCHSETVTSWTEGIAATNATIECPSINKINTSAKNMVEKYTWYLGGTKWKTVDKPYETYSVNELYVKERGSEVYNGHATTSSDYIGLIYPSDYGYASTNASCRQNLRSGLTYKNDAYGGIPICQKNNWLYKLEKWFWTISPNSTYADHFFSVNHDGSLHDSYGLYYRSVRPSLYLKSDVKIVSGIGTKDNMFKLEI